MVCLECLTIYNYPSFAHKYVLAPTVLKPSLNLELLKMYGVESFNLLSDFGTFGQHLQPLNFLGRKYQFVTASRDRLKNGISNDVKVCGLVRTNCLI